MEAPWLESLASGAVNAQMPPALALVVNLCMEEAPLRALAQLCPQQDYKVYWVNDPLGTALPGLREACADLGLPCLVLDSSPTAERYPLGPQDRVAWVTASDRLWDSAFDPQAAPCAYAAWLGYQTYLCRREHLAYFSDTYYEAQRLGVVRSHIHHTEPLLREARQIFFSMEALRLADYPHPRQKQPNGLYAEEFCQLCRYAGVAPQLQTLVFYGVPDGLEAGHPANALLAQALWHALEALALRRREVPGHPQWGAGLERLVVPLGTFGSDLVFYRSPQTGRWWMEISEQAGCIACSPADYLLAKKGEVPLKWLHYYPASLRNSLEV